MNLKDAIEKFHAAIWNFPEDERLELNTALNPEEVLELATTRSAQWDELVERSRSDHAYWERLVGAQYWHLIREIAQKAVRQDGQLSDLDPLPEPHALVMNDAHHRWVEQL